MAVANEKFETAAAEAGAEHIGGQWHTDVVNTPPVTQPMECLEFDGHKIDVRLTIRVPDPYGMEVVYEIERIWILAFKCIGTRVIPGYALALGANYSSDDVITAVKAVLLPHRRPEITIPGLTYEHRGGFPSEVLPECEYACWNRLRWDNAPAHISSSAITRISEFVGCWPEFGEKGQPDSRPFIESFFRVVSRNFAHRLPGTTGNNPEDVRRTLGDPKGDTTLLVTLDELEQLIDIVVSDYNGGSHGGLGGRTPLESMQYFVRRDPTVIRQLAKAKRDMLHLLQECLIKPIKGNPGEGVRPHINFSSVRYSNDVLSGNPALIGRSLRIYYDPKDISTVRAYFESGHELGVLVAQRPWCYTPHSLKTRQEIERLKALGKLRYGEGQDPMEAFMKYKRGKARKSRRDATSLARMLRTIDSRKASESAAQSRQPSAAKPAQTSVTEKPKVIELNIKKAIVF